MKDITLKEVARIAGVSTRTVSRVINNEKSVKDETKEKVLKIIKSTGYQVNLVAQSLKKKKTGILVVFIEKNEQSYIAQFHNVTIKNMVDEANKLGYKLVVVRSSANEVDENEHDGFYLLKNGFADGAVIFDTRQTDARLQYIVEKNIPHVIIGKDNMHETTSWVNLDNIKAGYIGAEYLIKKGYKSITFFLAAKNFTVNEDRVKGFFQACNGYGVNKDAYRIEYGVSSPQLAYERMKKILQNSQIPEAVFVSGDERALAVYHAIYEKGLKIPEDIAVIGIDNIPMSKYYYPPLTTIDQRVNEMAEQAIKVIDQQLKNPEYKSCQRIILQPKLIIRGSV